MDLQVPLQATFNPFKSLQAADRLISKAAAVECQLDLHALCARAPSHSNIADDPSRFHFTQARVREAFFCRPQPSLPSCSRSAFLVVRPVSAAVMFPKLRQQIPSSDQLLRQLGDRVLRFQRHWLDLVLEELRRDRTTSGCA